MAEVIPLHRLAQIMGHDSLDTTLLYIRGTKQDLQQDVEKIAWI
jgi:integrase/recombinase XerC